MSTPSPTTPPWSSTGPSACSPPARVGIGAASALCGFEGVRSWRAAAADEQGSSFPLAVLLVGLAILGGFIALRPWPTPGGKPIKVGAYVVDILSGKPPPVAAQTNESAVTALQLGLDSLIVLWAVGKAANAANAVADGFRGLGGGGGGGGGGTEGETEGEGEGEGEGGGGGLGTILKDAEGAE